MVDVVIVDDESLVRYGFELILNATDGIVVVGTCDGPAAYDVVADTRPDVVLLDVRMPKRNGLEVLRDLMRLPDPPAVAMLTTFDSEEHLPEAVELGASGFLFKDSNPAMLAQYVQVLAGGGLVFAPGIDRSHLTASTPSVAVPAVEFSSRDLRLLALLATGATNGQLATALEVSVSTVKESIRALQHAFGVDTRVQLALRAVQAGVVDAS